MGYLISPRFTDAERSARHYAFYGTYPTFPRRHRFWYPPVGAGVTYPDTNKNSKPKVHPIIWAIGIVGGLLIIERLLPGGKAYKIR